MAVDQWWVKCVEVHRLGTQELCAVSSRILLSSHQVKGCKALLGTHLEISKSLKTLSSTYCQVTTY